jgi:dihydrofolate reductase
LIYGSAQLVNMLRAHDLIDRHRLMVFPVMLGAGKRLFNAEDIGLKAFKLAGAATTSSGVAMLTYEIGES